ncbi:unnamed protein product [Caenorhabditis bovis]|uniref:Uncharacterized protein n=1 Tax=Caenorhabditis bovis TaxID=2654633 RepID=A0A8S1FAT8_9PELO|nr:unnamed protein product [Caenorhabditis bovis]
MTNCYIVIEVRETHVVPDIVNVLLQHPSTRFTVTYDIEGYAAERKKLSQLEKTTTIEDLLNTSSPRKKPKHEESAASEIKTEYPLLLQNGIEVDKEITNDLEDEAIREKANNIVKWCTQTSIEEAGESRKRKRPSRSFQCKLCGTFIKVRGYDYYKRSAHAIIHCDVLRFKCPQESCDYRAKHRSDICRHLRISHNRNPNSVRIPECLTPDEDEILRKMVLACFPEILPYLEGRKAQMKSWQFEEENKGNEEARDGEGSGGDKDDDDDDYED